MPSPKHPVMARTPSSSDGSSTPARQPWTKPELRAHSIARCTLVPKPNPMGDDGGAYS